MLHVREITYEADGQVLVGTLAVPEGAGPFPGVLIGHEGPGLDEVQRGAPRCWPGWGSPASHSTTTETPVPSPTATR